MNLLEFARGPAMQWALAIAVAGMCWRLGSFLAHPEGVDLHWSRKGFHVPRRRWQIDSYVMHAGMLTVVFGFAPHILFIHELIGIGWPAIPTGVVLFAAALTVTAMVAVLTNRLVESEPSGFSAFDDYFSWLVAFSAVLTGLLAYPHLGGASFARPYSALLTAHLIAVEALLIWLPFGKLAHLVLMPLLSTVSLLRQRARRLGKPAQRSPV